MSYFRSFVFLDFPIFDCYTERAIPAEIHTERRENMKTLYQNLDLHFTIENIPVHVLTLAFERYVHRIPSHSHGPGRYEIHYIASGYGKVMLKDCFYELSPEMIYVTGPGIEHSEMPLPENPMCEYCLYFKINSKTLTSAPLMRHFISQSVWIGKDRQNLLSLLRNISQEMQNQPLGYQERLSALLKQFLISLIRNYRNLTLSPVATSIQNLSDSKSVIAEDYFLYEYKNLSLEELSSRLSLSPRQTERFLKDFYGKTFLQKRTESRMSTSALLLTESDLSITAISEELGYSSPEHFTNAFRRYYGISPREFKKKQLPFH